jgi:hypothetical protein
VTWWRALERPAVVLLLIGTVLPIAATGRVTAGLVVTAMISWAFAVAVQFAAALIIAASVPTRRVSVPAAVHFLFAGHLPWSLWLLCFSMWAASDVTFIPGDVAVAISAIVPVAWTMVIVAAFCRTVLGTTRRGAGVRAVAHQAMIWSIALTYVAWAAGGWFRLVG